MVAYRFSGPDPIAVAPVTLSSKHDEANQEEPIRERRRQIDIKLESLREGSRRRDDNMDGWVKGGEAVKEGLG
jgi:hypothetical protein